MTGREAACLIIVQMVVSSVVFMQIPKYFD
jgi:hypothetical protein